MDTPDAPDAQATPDALDTENEAPQAPAEGTSQPDKLESFSDRFDPDSLDEPLRNVYNDMRGDYTRKTQELAEYRKQHEAELQFIEQLRADEEVQREVFQYLAEQLGFDLEDDEDEEWFEADPLDELSTKVETIEQRLHREHVRSSIDRQFAEIEGELGSGLTDKQKRTLVAHAAALDERDGEPDIRGAYEELTGFFDFEEKQKQWVQSKQTTPPPPSGKAGSKEIDMADPSARRKHMAEIMAREGAPT